jgi:hypothetical protein
MQEGRRHSTGVAFSTVENDEVPGLSRSYWTNLQLRRLCCNPATRSSLEHCGDIVSCPEEEEAAVEGRREERERERERERSHTTLRRVLGRVVNLWLRNACLPDAPSVELKTHRVAIHFSLPVFCGGSTMLWTHRVSVSFKSIARPQERRGRHRAWSADSAQGWDLLPAGLTQILL